MSEFREKIKKKMVRGIFNEKCKKLGVEATLEIEVLGHRPIVGENVYGQAFPDEKRVKLEVYPEATTAEVEEAVCDELIHVKWPELSQYDEKGHERKEYRDRIEECRK